MNKKKLIFSIALGGLLIQSTFANDINKGAEEFDLDSVQYIEEEEKIELGFDTADYLPEGFDAHSYYFDLDWVEYVEESNLGDIEIENHLPAGFDAYANPKGIEGINYIDATDEIVLDFNAQKYLPKDFDAYERG